MLNEVKLFDVIKTPTFFYFWEHVVLVSNFPPLLIAKQGNNTGENLFSWQTKFSGFYHYTRNSSFFSLNRPENANEITGKFIGILCVLFHAL